MDNAGASRRAAGGASSCLLGALVRDGDLYSDGLEVRVSLTQRVQQLGGDKAQTCGPSGGIHRYNKLLVA